MKQLFFTLMVFILPFVVVSCNENKSKEVKKFEHKFAKYNNKGDISKIIQ